ncbi:MAG TPA: hypothetical protein DCY40_02990 [Actinobacteria bacterium]|nr:hypothetical protein [Actinomycetota bacterium]
MRDAGYYRGLVDAAMRPYQWIVCADAAAGFTAGIRRWREQGFPRPLVLAGTPGTGDLPTAEECELVMLGTSGDTMMGGIRAFHDALRSLPPEVVARIEAWDPGGEARVLASFLDNTLSIAGRHSWGARPVEWLELEDKTRADSIWEAAAVDHAPTMVVPATAAELVNAAHALGGDAGTVWAGDNREGWHGGAEYTRYVADPDQAAETIEFMAGHCDRVRVMPFLEGVPCSIHGMVFPDSVAAFRPVEMVVFRVPGSDRFRYGSVATSWDPPDEVREEMRAAARRVGTHLRHRVGFRGVFTMDGVATADGWLPTELNPRFGAGLGPVARAADLPLLGLSRLLIAGETAGLDAVEIEEIAVAAADATRHLGGMTVVDRPVAATETVRVHWDGTAVHPVADGEGNAMLERGPAASGGAVRFVLDPEHVVPGTLGATVVAAAFATADATWDTGIGPLIPAVAH